MNATSFKGVLVSEISPGILLLTLDMPGSSANVLTSELFHQLRQTLEPLIERTELLGLILVSAKPSIFIAGADLRRINDTLDWPDPDIMKFCEDGRAIMGLLNQLPFPTVAAIHGACVGGGLEVALWCDVRIATDDRKTILGLPEVKLGLVPGWAGTVRLPRLIGLEPALHFVTTGKSISAREACDLGFVDRVVTHGMLISSAIEFIKESLRNKIEVRRRALQGSVMEMPSDLSSLRKTVLEQIYQNAGNVYPFACEVVLDHMLSSAAMNHDDACHSESLAMVRVYGSEPSYGLLNCFFLNEHIRKKPGRVDLALSNRQLQKIGIVGCGLMGRSIAELCLRSGHEVVMYDISQPAMAAAVQQFECDSHSHLPEMAGSYQDFRSCDLVIESVVEAAEIKGPVLQQLAETVPLSTILATNTSAIPLAKLAQGIQQREKFCGLHFCHPQRMQLVEVVAADETAGTTIADVTNWILKLKKTPVVVQDHPGFVLNRLLAAMLDQAFRLYTQGCALERIDQALRQFGFPGGPFEIVDVIGADVCLCAGRAMYEGGIRCVTLTPILPRLVKQGWLGRKSGRGFYRYDSFEGPPFWDREVDRLLAPYVQQAGPVQTDLKWIIDSICASMVLEGARVLDDQILQSAKDLDVCVNHGLGFPSYLGGILFWANRQGIQHVNKTLQILAQDDPKFLPNERLVQMERDVGKFY